jgi:cytochrome c biogenesis protein CcmG/thiol:disulfide interchange protein DsbE
LAVAAVIGVLVGIELLSGTSGRSGTGRRAPQLPTSVLVPPRVGLASLRGKPAAINFWASWCDPCRREAPALEHLARSLHGRARLVGVDWTDGLSGARSYVAKYHWTFPNLRDPNGTVGNSYELVGLPTTFILDPRGRIADVLRGPQSLETLRRTLSSAR